MRESDAHIDGCGVQELAGTSVSGGVSTDRYTVAPDESLDVAIVYAVAEAKGVEPMALERPLHDVVDADALREVFASADETLSATLVVDGHQVTITDGGAELIVSEV